MGRNFISACHTCGVQLMHLRGKEGDHMQKFENDHPKHNTEIFNDYQNEPPEEYRDVFDIYNPEFDRRIPLEAQRKDKK